jgi:hypothetical protein
MTFNKLSLAMLIALVAFHVSPIQASLPTTSVTFVWDPDPDSSVAGYDLYYGVACQVYTNVIDVGNVTTATVTGLVSGVTYYFAITAYDTSGLQSTFSSEIVYTVPPVVLPAATLTLASVAGGSPLLGGTATPGYTFDVQCSGDLSAWSTIGSVTADDNGSVQFADTNALSNCRFYRLRQSSP